MAIHLPPEIEASIQQQIVSGRYASIEEVVVAGVRLLEARDRKRQRLLAALAECEEGEGIPFTPDLLRQFREEADDLGRRGVPPELGGWT